MGERAVLYARVSTEVQAEGYSLATQLESCRQYAATRGYRVVGEYSDRYSGEFLRRPQLSKLAEQVYSESIQVVVVHDLDRFTRNPGHLAILELEFEQAGARVEFVMGAYTDTPEGQLSKAIKSVIAQYENRQRVERSQRGRRGRLEVGLVRAVGARAPYGYHYAPGKGVLTIIPQEADVIRWMFAHARDGIGPHLLAANLTAAAVLRADGTQKAWHPNGVRRMLRNSIYCGIWSEQVAGQRYIVETPAIISAELWAAVQEVMNSRLPKTPPQPALLTGFMTCVCGQSWVARRGDSRSYYRCSSVQQRLWRDDCPIPGSIRSERLEAPVFGAIAAILQQPNWLDIALASRERELRSTRYAQDAQAQVIMDALTRLERREASLLDSLLDSHMSSQAVESAIKELAVERTNLEVELKQLKTALPIVPTLDSTEINQLVATGLDRLDLEHKRRLFARLDLRLVIERQDLVHLSILDGLSIQHLTIDPLILHLSAPEQRIVAQRPAYRPRKEIKL